MKAITSAPQALKGAFHIERSCCKSQCWHILGCRRWWMNFQLLSLQSPCAMEIQWHTLSSLQRRREGFCRVKNKRLCLQRRPSLSLLFWGHRVKFILWVLCQAVFLWDCFLLRHSQNFGQVYLQWGHQSLYSMRYAQHVHRSRQKTVII